MEITLSIPFSYQPHPQLTQLLQDFREMLNFCIERAVRAKITSYYSLRKLVYAEFKSKWNYSTHFCHSACRVAASMLRSWRKLKREGLARSERPIAKKLFIQLDQQLVKFDGDRLRISIRPRQFITIQLKYGEYQQKFIQEWKAGKLRVGEITINQTKVLVPFRKDLDLADPEEWIAIDINEANLTGVSSNPHMLRIDHPLRTIHTTYFQIRRGIQRLAAQKPITATRLLQKYSGREKNRIRDACHKISRAIVNFAKQHQMGIILEDLKGIRRRIRSGRKLNRRLHSWNFSRLQFCIQYKAQLEGLPVIYADPRNTSSLCPICGGRLAPNGHRVLKCSCGFQSDRDVIACLNLLRMRGAPLPLNASAELERIVKLTIRQRYSSSRGKGNICLQLRYIFPGSMWQNDLLSDTKLNLHGIMEFDRYLAVHSTHSVSELSFQAPMRSFSIANIATEHGFPWSFRPLPAHSGLGP